MNDQREHEDLKRTAPTLFGMERNYPFVVSESFFERFPHEVQAAIISQQERKGWASWPLLLRRAVVALPVIATIAGAWMFFSHTPDQGIADLSHSPSLEDLNWTEEHELLASLDEEDLPALGELDIELTEAELAAYLTHENVDIAELMIEP